MKILSKTVISFLFVLVASVIIYSCKTSKGATKLKIVYLEGVYQTEKMPADIGAPYRLYLKFKKDGTVLSMSSPIECDSINTKIEKNWAEKATYTIFKTDSIKFIFINNRVNNGEYTATYKAKITSLEKLDFRATISRKGDKPYINNEKYTICK